MTRSSYKFTYPRTNVPCPVCGGVMTCGQPGTHFACDPGAVEGKSCTCPPDCSRRTYGDGPRACDPECVPCRARRGQRLSKL